MTFAEWLRKYKNYNSPLGDLSREADMQDGDTIENVWREMLLQNACKEARNAFRRAVNKYLKDLQ